MLPSVPDESTSPPTRVLIVDDEPLARDCIRLALALAERVEIVGECGDAAEAVQAIERLTPDLVFLDVQMPGMDGFGVLDALEGGTLPAVVFVTAYDAHAVRAFEVHAADYVLKPFEDARLVAAFEHARAVVHERRHGALARELAAVVRRWAERDIHAVGGADVDAPSPALTVPQSRYVTRFAVRNDGNVRFVAAHDVDWIEADSNYLVLHVGATSHRIRATIRDLASELDPRRFTRIHRSAIVNVERIRELQPWFGGDYIAILRSGEKLKVSRQRVRELLRPTA